MKNIIRNAAVALALLVSSPGAAAAQGDRHLVLEDVEITEEFDCSTIRVSFTLPVRYVRHFPYEKGDDLRVELQPLTPPAGDKEALFQRESYRPPSNEVAGLQEVVYEGNVEGGPYLSLYFSREAAFRVGQGADFRSIVIAVSGPDAAEPCELPEDARAGK